jgi:hypothetical protein
MNPLTTAFLWPDPAFSDARAVDALLQPHRMHPFRYAHGDPLTDMDRNGAWIESGLDVVASAEIIGSCRSSDNQNRQNRQRFLRRSGR